MAKIGDVIERDGVEYKAVEADFMCEGCAFDKEDSELCLVEEDDRFQCWSDHSSTYEALFEGIIFVKKPY